MTDERAAIRLVVNADGFGESDALDRGVLRGYRDGVVTSTSVLANCNDPLARVALLRATPGLGVGAHLTLLGGAPVSPASAVRSLVGPEGLFPTQASELVLAWANGTMRGDDVERELDAQVGRLRDAGLTLDHLSTRHHIGFLPTVGRAVEAVARRHGIAGIRMAMERPTLAWVAQVPRALMATALGGLAWLTRRQMGLLRHGPQSWGYVASGHLDEIRILEIIGRLAPGSHELICRPLAVGDAPNPDLVALVSPRVRHALGRRGIELCRWSELF